MGPNIFTVYYFASFHFYYNILFWLLFFNFSLTLWLEAIFASYMTFDAYIDV